MIEETKKKILKKPFNVLITTVPFGEFDRTSLEKLDGVEGINFVINPLNRKLKEDELAELIYDYDALIAGTEPITKKVLEQAKKLKIISRVGIGLDSVDLLEAREKGIVVTYTPDAPSPAVAELTIGHMINLLRGISLSDNMLKNGLWKRIQGERISTSTIGIIGVGRIGTRVLHHLQGFLPKRILVNDTKRNDNLYKKLNAEYVSKQEIYENADIISLHVPLTNETNNLIGLEEMKSMKSNAVLINTSRGGIINEDDLYTALKSGIIKAAAIDVFVKEPYKGKLTKLSNCYFTCHMGSMTKDCRARMEIEAVDEVLRFFEGKTLKNIVPEEEYANRINLSI